MLRRLFSAALAAVFALAVSAPAFAGGPMVGNVRKVDAFWPLTNPNSGCWTVQVRNQKTWAPDTNPDTLTVIRQGFDANAQPTLYTDNLVITTPVRQPWVSTYPGSSYLYSGDRAALSNYIYSTDFLPGGVKNLCTSVAPQPVGQWANTTVRQVNGNTLGTVEVAAFSRDARNNGEVAAVKCTADDHNGHTVSGTVSAMTLSTRALDANHQVTIYLCPALDLTTLTNAHYFTVDACLYPWIGGNASVNCTNNNAAGADGSDANNTSGRASFSTLYFYKDTGNKVAVFLCPLGSGSGSCTAAASTSCTASKTVATAAAAPCSTMRAAINAAQAFGAVDNTTVYVGPNGGTNPVFDGVTSGTLAQNGGCLTITRDSGGGITRANAKLAFAPASGNFISLTTLANVNTGCIQFTDLSMVRASNQNILGAASCTSSGRLKIVFKDVNLDDGSFAPGYLNQGCVDDEWDGVTVSNWVTGPLGSSSSGHHRFFRGVLLPGGTTVEGHTVLGSQLTANPNVSTPNGGTDDGMVVAFNSFEGLTTQPIGISTTITNGLAVVQNTFENTTTASNISTGFNNDALTNSVTNVIWQYNSYAGFDIQGRVNIFYDEAGTKRFTRMQDSRGNVPVSIYSKSDIFDGTNDADANGQQRTGPWAFQHGVGSAYNYEQFTTTAPHSMTQVYSGLGSVPGTIRTGVGNNPLYTTDAGTKSGPTAGTPSGSNFVPQAGSPLKGMVKVPMLPFDLGGTARPATNDTSGAFKEWLLLGLAARRRKRPANDNTAPPLARAA